MPSSSTPRFYKTSTLTKGAPSFDELRTLFQNWKTDEEPIDFARRLRTEGILVKQTAQRADDLVLRMFRSWFLSPDTQAAARIQKILRKNVDWQTLNELFLLYKSRAETVLYDFLILGFWAQFQDGALYLRKSDIEDFNSEAIQKNMVEKQWSVNTTNRLIQGMFVALKDAGFLKEEKQGLYAFVNYRVSGFMFAYLAYDLHFTGLTDQAVIDHPDWQLFGLKRPQILQALSDVGSMCGLLVQQAGSVVRITWNYASMDEVIDAYFDR